MIPEEIIEHIGSRNVYFYLTCQSMFHFIHLFYKKQIVHWKTNLLIANLINKDIMVNNVLVIKPKPLSIDLNDHYYHHVFKIVDLNMRIDLPRCLTSLTFDDSYNQVVNLVGLTQLKRLTFGDQFDQSLENCLPLSLTSLTFSRRCRYNLPHYNFRQNLFN